MRPEEEFVKGLIETQLHKDEYINITPGEDPPDYYVNTKQKKILLEITAAEDIYIESEDYDFVVRRGLDSSLLWFIEALRKRFDGNIPNGDSILLFFQGPFENFSKFKRSVEDVIADVCQKDIPIEKELEIYSGKVMIKRISFVENKIVGIIGVKNNKYSGNIEKQTEMILENIITTKERKTQDINGEPWGGEKWLGILNNCVLVSLDTFYRVLKRVTVEHNFSRIYIVNKDSNVIDVLN